MRLGDERSCERIAGRLSARNDEPHGHGHHTRRRVVCVIAGVIYTYRVARRAERLQAGDETRNPHF